VRAIVVHERGGPEVPELDGGRGRLPLPGTAHNLELTELSFRRRRPTRSRAQLKGAERGETAVCARRTPRTNLPIRRERRAPRTEKLTSTGIGGPDSQIRAHIRLGRGFSARWLCLWGRSHWCLGSSQASRFWFRAVRVLQRRDSDAASRARPVLRPKPSSPVPLRLALMIALTSSALALLPILGSRLARLLGNYLLSHGARLSRAGAGLARPPWASPATSANLGVSRALPPQTKPRRFSRSPAWRLTFARVMLREASIRSLLYKTAEGAVLVGLSLVLGAAIGILAALYGG
jgi:hypothetical protein